MARERSESTPVPPIESWFIARRVTDGEAPLVVRQQWIGVPLPVRYEGPVEAPDPRIAEQILSRETVLVKDAVSIKVEDAIKTLLLFDKVESAVWWEEMQRRGLINLIFDLRWGEWLSNDLAQKQFPQIKNFDTNKRNNP